jgi:hypothetical protein
MERVKLNLSAIRDRKWAARMHERDVKQSANAM